MTVSTHLKNSLKVKVDTSSDRLEKILHHFGQSNLGKQFLKFVQAEDVTIKFDAQIEGDCSGQYYPGCGIVTLNPWCNDLTLISVLSHELRHCWQDFHKLDCQLTSTPFKRTIYRRFQEADAYAYQLYFAHKHFEDTGKTELIDTLTSNPFYKHLTQAFKKTWGQTNDLHQTYRAVFDAYFDNGNPIKARYDTEFFEFVDKIDSIYQLDNRYKIKPLSEDFDLSHLHQFGFIDIRITPESSNYFTETKSTGKPLNHTLYYTGFGIKHAIKCSVHTIYKSSRKHLVSHNRPTI